MLSRERARLFDAPPLNKIMWAPRIGNLAETKVGKPTRQGPVGPVEIPEENGTIFSDYCKLGQPIEMAFAIFCIFSEGAFHSAKPTGQRSVGIPEENGTTFSD